MWRKREPVPPQGVRLRLLDGTAVECDLVCDPERRWWQRWRRMTKWFAVPRETHLSAPPSGIECDMPPGHTSLVLAATFSLPEA
jgi:hypothetical protein